MDISSVIGWVASFPLDTYGRRSAIDREELKQYWNLEKKPHFLMWLTSLSFLNFSNILLSTKSKNKQTNKLSEHYFWAVHLFHMRGPHLLIKAFVFINKSKLDSSGLNRGRLHLKRKGTGLLCKKIAKCVQYFWVPHEGGL